MALALSLNTHPERDKMKIMFLRECEGVYQFGQKRVYIKIEHGDQPFIRVGGGYMHVREFIDQYTQGELDKIERKNVIKRFLNKIQTQRVATRQAVHSVERGLSQKSRSHRSTSPSKLSGYGNVQSRYMNTSTASCMNKT